LSYLSSLDSTEKFVNFSEILEEMRMIKSPEELQVARHAGQVANAMMKAGREAIIDGRPEFEVAIATSAAGTRLAAELLEKQYSSTDMSPNTHFLQIMASGEDIVKTHHRASTRIMRIGDPVFLCFCGMTNFYKFKLGFDRTFWINSAKPEHIKVYKTALSSQEAALSVLGPGVKAEHVHEAYAEVIQDAGYDYPFRCGRATGYSFLEKPFLIKGDKTILQPGMVFAVDGSVLTNDFRAQVGDSFIITETGYEQITHHPKTVDEIII
jgi:Xaa-Pro aminopeptidase